MIKFKLIYFTIGVLLLSLMACEKLIFDEIVEDISENNSKVYLSVSTRAAQSNSGLRTSINMDTNFEDRVYSLSMVIFESGTDKMIGEPYINSNLGKGVSAYAFTVEIKPGNYDFYFIANAPELEKNLENLSGRLDLENLMNSLRTFDGELYKRVTSSKGIPMARIYKEQKVEAGGTVYQPLPFRPKFNITDNREVIATNSLARTTTTEFVELIRVAAKLEISFDNISAEMVDEITYHNAFGDYSLTPQPIPVASPNYAINSILEPITGTNTYLYYIPEALMATPSWNSAGDNKPINYFSISTKGGEQYKVPIITTNSNIIFSENYLAKATGADASFIPDYNIYRNHHYKFTIRIHQEIEILYAINPWNIVQKQLFMGYGYNVEIDEKGKITVSNTIDDCLPHKIRLEAINGAHFGTMGDDERLFGFSSDDLTVEPSFDPTKLKTDYFEEYEINTEGIAIGTAYLNIYYNGMPVKTFTK